MPMRVKTGLSGYSFQTAEAQFQTAYSIKTAVPLVVATYSLALKTILKEYSSLTVFDNFALYPRLFHFLVY